MQKPKKVLEFYGGTQLLKKSLGILLWVLFSLSGKAQRTVEIAVNGNFNDLTAYYLYVSHLPYGSNAGWWQGLHNLTTNPQSTWGWAPSFTDHTGNNGGMMIADGANWAGHRVWGNDFYLTQGRTYTFSVWVRDFWGGATAAQLFWSVNWNQVGATVTAQAGVWTQLTVTYVATYTGITSIEIRNAYANNNNGNGNDFAIDDVSILEEIPVTCSGTFFDSGGNGSNYGNNEDITTTYCSDYGENVRLAFTQFNTQNNQDILRIYDGPTTSSTLIGNYSGTNSPGTVTSTSGCLTFRFTSNNSSTRSGWRANISCVNDNACSDISSVIIHDLVGSNDITITNGATVNLGQLSSSWNIESIAAGNSQSVGFEVTGSTSLSHTENVAPYRLAGDNNPLNWPPGTYNIVVTQYSQDNRQGNICDVKNITLVIEDCNLNGFSASANTPVCTGNNLNLTTSGAGAGVSYLWSGPNGFSSTQANPTITNVGTSASGNYQVTATSNGCTATASVAVATMVSPSTTVSVTQANCGLNNGSITFTFPDQSGRTNIAFSINNQGSYTSVADNIGSYTFSNLAPGSYNLWTRWGNQECPVDLPDEVILRESGSMTVTPATATICEGSSTNLTASLANAVGTTTYSWSNGLGNGASKTVSPSATTTYTVTGTDSQGCTGTATVQVIVNARPNPTATSNSPVCGGGTIQLNGNGGNTYSWTGPNSFSSNAQNPQVPNANASKAGSYVLTATNANGCTNTTAVTVAIDNSYTITASTPFTEYCLGQNVQLNASGANTYSWTGPNGFSSNSQNPILTSITSSQGGTYTISGANAQNCTATATVAINITSVIPSVSNNSPSCVGDNVQLNAGGGNGYSWTGPNGFTSTNQNPQILNVQSANEGVYTVTVTRNGACSVTATTQVTVYNLPNIVVSNTGPVCTGQNITLQASGGVSYSWAGPNSFSSNNQNPTVSSINTAKTGAYTVTVTNAVGCSATATTQVNLSIPNLVISADTALCVGGTIQINSSGGTSYSWTGPNGFSSTNSSFSIANATAIHAGNYSVTVNNALGCTATTQVNVAILSTSPSITINSGICTGDSLKMTVPDWSTYNWSGPGGFTSSSDEPSIANASTGNNGVYSVTLTVPGCTATASVSAVIRPLPVPIISSNQPVCIGNNLNFSTSTFSSYTWSGPQGFSSSSQNPSISSVTTLREGTYTLSVTNTWGCIDSTTHFVDVDFVTPSATNNGPFCIGDNGTLTASGGVNYTWTGPNSFSSTLASPNLSNIQSNFGGIYSVSIINANGCTATATTAVIVSIPIATTGSNSPVCEETTLNLSASGGVGYTWTGPNSFTSGAQNPTINNVSLGASGVYSVTVLDNVGCTATSTISVSILPKPTITISNNGPVCEANSLNLFASGGALYSWSGPGGFVSSAQNPVRASVPANGNGVYTVTVTDIENCQNTATTNAIVNPLPNVTAGAVIQDICITQTINLLGSGGGTYAWTGPVGFTSTQQNPDRTNSAVGFSGIYTLTVTTVPQGCTASASVAITVNTIPEPPDAPNVSRCGPGTVTLTASGCAGIYTWYSTNSSTTPLGTGETFTSPSLSSNRSYFVDCTEFTCPSSARRQVNVTILPLPTATASVTGVHCIGTTARFFGGGNNVASYSWSGPQGFTSSEQSPFLAISRSNEAGTYTLTNTRSNGCTATATVNLSIDNNCNSICTQYVQARPNNPSTCTNSNGSIHVQAYAGYYYETSIDGINWFNNDYLFTNLGVGRHLIYLRDQSSNTICRTVWVTLVANDNNQTYFTGFTTTSASGCFAPTGTITLQGVLPTDEVNWISSLDPVFTPVGSLSPVRTITGLSPGSYYVKVIRNSNQFCFSQQVVTIANSGDPCITGVFCDADTLDNLFPNGDFGSGAPVVGTPLDPSVTQYGFVWMNCNSPNDGFYTIVNNTDCDGTSGNRRIFGTWDVLMEDHTPGDVGGYMMMVNASFNPDIVVEQRIDNLCPNAQYNFTAYVRDLLIPPSPSSNPILPNLSFLIDGVVQYTTGPITSVGSWEQVGFSFKTGNLTSAVFSIRNNAPGGYGNDWLIDDVTVSKCPLTINLEGTTVACLGGVNETIEATVGDPLQEYNWYKWQQSLDGTTWTDVSTPTQGTYNSGVMNVSLTLPTPIPSSISGIDYRIVLATESDAFQYTSCTVSSALTKILVPPIEINITDDLEKCVGSGSVTLTATASGGTEPYQYQWNNGGGSTASISVNPPNTTLFVVTAMDADSCSAQDTVLVTVNDQPSLTVTIDQDSVCQNGNALITAQVVGGSGNFTYTWYSSPNGSTGWTVIPGQTSASYAPPTNTPGQLFYRVFVEDLTFDCNDAMSNPVPFTVVPQPTVLVNLNNSPVCIGGSVTLTANTTNTIGNLSYNWYSSTSPSSGFTQISGANGVTYNPNTSATGSLYYRVEAISAASGCSAIQSSSVEVEVLPVFTASVSGSDATVCRTGSATLTANVLSGTGTISYQWQSSTDNVNFNSISGATDSTYLPNTNTAGTFYFRVNVTASGEGCGTVSSASYTLVVLPDFAVTVSPSNSQVCVGASVTINSNPVGGVGSVSYQWAQSTDNINFTDISGATTSSYVPSTATPGIFYYRIAASSTGPGCGTATATSSVTVNDIALTSSGNQTICEGNQVTINATVSGGVGPYTYSWNNGLGSGASHSFLPPSTNSPTGNTSTPYTVTVTDAQGCTASSSLNINVLALPSVTLTSTDEVCPGQNNGSITFTFPDNTNRSWIEFSLDNGSTYPFNSADNAGNMVVSNLSPGTYAVWTRWGNDECPVDLGTVTIDPGVSPSPTIGNNGPICEGETLVLSSSGGSIYVWDGPNGFSSSAQNPTISSAPIAATGVYTVTITSAIGCTATATTSATVNALPLATAGSNSPICTGSSINLTSTGGNSYSWAGPAGYTSTSQNPSVSNANPSMSGVYTVTVTSTEGCISTATASVYVNDLNLTNSGNQTICEGNQVTINAIVSGGVGPYTYSWNNGLGSGASHTFLPPSTNSPTGNTSTPYTVTVTDAQGCTASSSLNINVLALPSVTLTSTDEVCPGQNNGSITFTFPDNTNRSWIEFSLDNGSTYPFDAADNAGNMVVSNLSPDTYAVWTRWGNDECPVDLGTVTIDPGVSPSPTIGSNGPICEGETLVLSSSGGVTYSWSGPNGFNSSAQNPNISSATVTMTGIYSVTVTSVDGCTATATTNVVVNPLPIPVSSGTSPICEGGNLSLSASGGTSYSWSGPNGFSSTLANPTINSVNTVHSGNYVVSVTNEFGCTIDAPPVNVVVVPVFNASISASDNTICLGGSVTITADTTGGTGSVSYQWFSSTNNLDFTPISGATGITFDPPVNAVSVNYYRVVASSTGFGCGNDTTASVTISVLPNFDVAVTIDNAEVCEGGSVTLDATPISGTGTITYQWQQSSNGTTFTNLTGETNTTYNPNTSTSGTNYYRVLATASGNGCGNATSSNAEITVVPQLSVQVNIPNAEVCLNESLEFSSNTTNGVGNIVYQWQSSSDGTSWSDLPGETNNTLQVPTSAAGLFYYRVNADALGVGCNASSSSASTVRVHDYPSVTASFIRPLCVPDNGSITFTFSDSPAIDSLEFSLDGGSIFAYQSPDNAGSYQVNGITAGVYPLAVRYANNLCPVTLSTLDILDRPSPDVTVSYVNPTCSNPSGSITFTFPDEPTRTGIKFSINGISGLTGSIPDNSGSYTFSGLGPGTYDLRTQWGNDDCPIDLADVTLVDQPSPILTLSPNTVLCEGESYDINLNISGGTAPITYSWNNGLPTALSHTVSPLTDQLYIVTVIDSNNCQVVDTVSVEVNPVPVLNATGATVCEFDTIFINADGIGVYSWTGPNSFASNEEDPFLLNASLSMSGIYSVTLTNNFACTTTATVNVLVNPRPAPLSISNAERCGPGVLNLEATGCSGTITWYDHQFSNSAVATGTNFATPSLDETNFYFVTCTTPFNCETFDREPVEAKVNEASYAELLPINSTCYGKIPINNGQMIATRFEDGETYSFNEGSTYNASIATSFTAIPENGLLTTSIPNPTAAVQYYTVRVISVDGCPKDLTLEFQEACLECKPYCEPSQIEKVK